MSADPAVSTMPDLDNEPYDSAEDEDFQLDAAQDESNLSSSDAEDEAAQPARKKRKRDAKIDEQELDSGDEATIRKAKERKAKKRKGRKGKDNEDGDIELDEDDGGGTGGFVRTRAMRMRIHEERKPLAKIDGATVDVDALWEKMNAPDVDLRLQPIEGQQNNEPASEPDHAADTEIQDQSTRDSEDKLRQSRHPEQMIKIKRTYKFAGDMITEEKIVPKDSAEAKASLARGETVEYAEIGDTVHADFARKLRRPLRKISRFDPNPTGAIKKSWEKQPAVAAGPEEALGPKINTVEKSRLDWAVYVDQAGIQDELRVHSKAKEGYMGRMDFLGRMDAKREDERRNARLRGM